MPREHGKFGAAAEGERLSGWEFAAVDFRGALEELWAWRGVARAWHVAWRDRVSEYRAYQYS